MAEELNGWKVADADDLIVRLSNNRRSRRMSQRAVAELMGTTQSHVSNIETGTTGCSLDVAFRWLDALGFDLALIPREES